jgi:hypothetical protein
MSKHETPMTRWYWRTVNQRLGLLIEEFPAVKRDGSAGKNKRHIDGVIVLGEKAERRGPRKGDRELVKGKRVIVIKSKARRLGMGLIGQVVVSRELLDDLAPMLLSPSESAKRTTRSSMQCSTASRSVKRLSTGEERSDQAEASPTRPYLAQSPATCHPELPTDS